MNSCPENLLLQVYKSLIMPKWTVLLLPMHSHIEWVPNPLWIYIPPHVAHLRMKQASTNRRSIQSIRNTGLPNQPPRPPLLPQLQRKVREDLADSFRRREGMGISHEACSSQA